MAQSINGSTTIELLEFAGNFDGGKISWWCHFDNRWKHELFEKQQIATHCLWDSKWSKIFAKGQWTNERMDAHLSCPLTEHWPILCCMTVQSIALHGSQPQCVIIHFLNDWCALISFSANKACFLWQTIVSAKVFKVHACMHASQCTLTNKMKCGCFIPKVWQSIVCTVWMRQANEANSKANCTHFQCLLCTWTHIIIILSLTSPPRSNRQTD